MDLNSFDTKKASEAGADMYLRDPATRRPLKGTDDQPVIFRVVGKHAGSYIKAQNRITDRRLKEMRGRGPQSNSADLQEEGIELLSAAIISVTPNFKVDGAVFQHSPQSVRKLLSDERFIWVKEQVDEFVGDIANFLEQ